MAHRARKAAPAQCISSGPCQCPRYEGSDFWNDPHLWCGVDPVSERCWNGKSDAACEIDFDYSINPDYWAEQRRFWMMQAQTAQVSDLAAYQQSQLSPYANLAQTPGHLNQTLAAALNVFGSRF
jgi:hypothetical protein